MRFCDTFNSYDYDKFSSVDVYNALQKSTCEIHDLMALLSPAAGDFIEEMAQKAQAKKTRLFWR